MQSTLITSTTTTTTTTHKNLRDRKKQRKEENQSRKSNLKKHTKNMSGYSTKTKEEKSGNAFDAGVLKKENLYKK